MLRCRPCRLRPRTRTATKSGLARTLVPRDAAAGSVPIVTTAWNKRSSEVALQHLRQELGRSRAPLVEFLKNANHGNQGARGDVRPGPQRMGSRSIQRFARARLRRSDTPLRNVRLDAMTAQFAWTIPTSTALRRGARIVL